MNADLPREGDVIAGKYRIVRKLGSGGMGVVFEAMHEKLRQRVAIKMLLPTALTHRQAVERFEREARAAAQLKGAHVARVVDVDSLPSGAPYMVMEFLEGSDLAAELEARGRLPVGEAVDYVQQACEAMAEAHALGIVHRDLKPANLFLTTVNGRRTLKVLDFGISKVMDDEGANVTSTHASLGTPLYMSPEHVRSAKHVDAQSDVWSLGVILYELLTGRPPFVGEGVAAVAASITADEPTPPRELEPSIPESLERALLIALSKKKEGRYPSAHALSAALGGVTTTDRTRDTGSSGGVSPVATTTTTLAARAVADTLAAATPAALPARTAGEWSTGAGRAPAAEKRGGLVLLLGAAVVVLAALLAWRTLRSGAEPGQSAMAVASSGSSDSPTPVASGAATASTPIDRVAASASAAAAPSSSVSADKSASVASSPASSTHRSGVKAAPPPSARPSPPSSTAVDRGF
jgi:serine/threonine-protein kinase